MHTLFCFALVCLFVNRATLAQWNFSEMFEPLTLLGVTTWDAFLRLPDTLDDLVVCSFLRNIVQLCHFTSEGMVWLDHTYFVNIDIYIHSCTYLDRIDQAWNRWGARVQSSRPYMWYIRFIIAFYTKTLFCLVSVTQTVSERFSDLALSEPLRVS